MLQSRNLQSRKSLWALSCAVVPVVYGAAAMAQDVVQPVPFSDGNPVVLPGNWPSSAGPNMSATGSDPVIVSGNNSFNGAPNNGGSGVLTFGNPPSTGGGAINQSYIGSGQDGSIVAETFQTSRSFTLAGISVELNEGESISGENSASLHLYQLNNTVTGSSTQYNLATQAASGDLLGSGGGVQFAPPNADNIEQFVFTGADQVTLQANTEYSFEFWLDQDSGDILGVNTTAASDNKPGPQPYTAGQAYQVLQGANATNYGQTDSATTSGLSNVPRQAIASSARNLLFAVYAVPVPVVTGTWTGTAGDSNWNTGGNWVNSAVPGATAGDSALFSSTSGGATQTVNLDGNQTVGAITFNNATLFNIAPGTGGTITLKNASGAASITGTLTGDQISAAMTMTGGVAVSVAKANDVLLLSGNIGGTGGVTIGGAGSPGTVVMSGSNTYSGGTTVASGTLLVEPTAKPATTSALPTGTLAIGSASSAANVVLASNATLGSQSSTPKSSITLSALSITANSTLDIGNNHIIINYGSGADPISSIVAMIASGYNAGAWNGTGIISSAAAATSGYGIGFADSADTGNPGGLSSGQIELMYTLLGDANLDGKVNGADFAVLATNFNKAVAGAGGGWDQGDFNYDGKINGADFAALAGNFNKGASQAADAQALDAFSAANGLNVSVPEPGALGLAVTIGAGALARRRSRRG
jgi:autotransporter-associated beta strand protein